MRHLMIPILALINTRLQPEILIVFKFKKKKFALKVLIYSQEVEARNELNLTYALLPLEKGHLSIICLSIF